MTERDPKVANAMLAAARTGIATHKVLVDLAALVKAEDSAPIYKSLEELGKAVDEQIDALRKYLND